MVGDVDRDLGGPAHFHPDRGGGLVDVTKKRPKSQQVVWHDPFLTPVRADGQRASAVTQLMQPVVVDPEVVGDLVRHGDLDLFSDLVGVGTDAQGGQPEDGDPVR